MIWLLLPVPYTLKFPLLTAFVLPGLWRAQARLPKLKPKPLPEQPNTKMSLQILRIALVFLLLILLNFLPEIFTNEEEPKVKSKKRKRRE